jgi:hypothetical protein
VDVFVKARLTGAVEPVNTVAGGSPGSVYS